MNNTVEIYINDIKCDITNEISLQITSVICDPTKITTTQTEYSFTFDLPLTKINNKIFDFSNNLSKLNKFNKRYNCKIIVNQNEIFSGLLKITEISNDSYKCNVFLPKQNTLETIFGDSVMSDLDWKVEFKGVETLNTVNYDITTKYFFPLISYGLFQKQPKTIMGNKPVYSSKTKIDGQNRFYYNSIIPSLNLVEVVKRCFDSKGYTLGGDILTDRMINDIYMSNYISDNQDPLYNYGNPELGSVTLEFACKNKMRNDRGSGWTYMPGNEYTFKYAPEEYKIGDYNNFSSINWLNVLDVCQTNDSPERDGFGYFISKQNNSNMYTNGFISIPANGFYKISLQLSYKISDEQQAINRVVQYTTNGTTQTVTKQKNATDMPIEFHLCKFSGDDGSENNLQFELIKRGEYPNEAKSTTNPFADVGVDDDSDSQLFNYSYCNFRNEGATQNTTAVDPLPNPDFICGLCNTQWSNGNAYIKSGTSWSIESDTRNDAIYNCSGYDLKKTNKNTPTITYTVTDWNENFLQNAVGNSSTNCEMIVKLNKNDLIGLYMLYRVFQLDNTTRPYADTYAIDLSYGKITVEAIAVESTPVTNIKDYNMTSNFDKQLNLGNFLNNQEKMSDFLNNVIKAFNLSLSIYDKNIFLNFNKINNNFEIPLTLKNNISENNIISKDLNLPKSVEIKYKIDSEERGFYLSVPDDKLELNNWTSYGDYGNDKIIYSNIEDINDLTQEVNFSYNYFQPFEIYDFVRLKNDEISTVNVNLPVIGKDEWYIENLNYDEYAKEDGKSFVQRFWFRQLPLEDQPNFHFKLPIGAYYKEATDKNYYQICLPTNTKRIGNTTYELSYKNNNNITILKNYFNLNYDMSQNSVEFETTLTIDEYKDLKNGRPLKIDDDIYFILEIKNFNVRTGECKILAIKAIK